jgi:alanyl-tRNA synthetase
VGDTGVLIHDKSVFTVTDTAKKLGKLHVHVGMVESGVFEVGKGVEARVDTHAARKSKRTIP